MNPKPYLLTVLLSILFLNSCKLNETKISKLEQSLEGEWVLRRVYTANELNDNINNLMDAFLIDSLVLSNKSYVFYDFNRSVTYIEEGDYLINKKKELIFLNRKNANSESEAVQLTDIPFKLSRLSESELHLALTLSINKKASVEGLQNKEVQAAEIKNLPDTLELVGEFERIK